MYSIIHQAGAEPPCIVVITKYTYFQSIKLISDSFCFWDERVPWIECKNTIYDNMMIVLDAAALRAAAAVQNFWQVNKHMTHMRD